MDGYSGFLFLDEDGMPLVSYFDLIYYTDEVNKLVVEKDRERSNVLKGIYDGMVHGIRDFFTNKADARSVINSLTKKASKKPPVRCPASICIKPS